MLNQTNMKDIQCFLLDMDGTIYLDSTVIDRAVETVRALKSVARVIYLTNNSSKGRADYAQKLSAMGFPAAESDILTSGTVTVDYLHAEYPRRAVHLLGNTLLTAEFEAAGINLTNENPDLVVIGFDTELTYDKLDRACHFIRNGVPFIATHPDDNCPTSYGFKPDVGAFLSLIKTSTGGSPLAIIGKPHTPVSGAVQRLTGLKPHQIAMVGDRLNTDMQFAINCGFVPMLVLTGEATRESLQQSGLPVSIVLNSIADLLDVIPS